MYVFNHTSVCVFVCVSERERGGTNRESGEKERFGLGKWENRLGRFENFMVEWMGHSVKYPIGLEKGKYQ